MSKPKMEVREVQIRKIEWDPAVSSEPGSYAHVMEINFNQNEFVLAFGQIVGVDAEAGVQKCKLVSKVLVPHHLVPRILEVVEDNLGKFTEVFGEPKEPQLIAKRKR